MKSDTTNAVEVTVLTPTYNRAAYLPRLYESLSRQGCKRFVWLVIDDGSEDSTRETVENFPDSGFETVYRYKENGGKHTAINYGMQFVTTEYTFLLDSDDYLTDDAMDYVYRWIDEIRDLPLFAGVAGTKLCIRDGKPTQIGDFPKKKDYTDCTNTERIRNHLMGDKAEVYKTELLKQLPFPVFEGERFIRECVVWDRIAELGRPLRWHKEGTVVCEYLEGGLSDAVKKPAFFAANFQGYREAFTVNFRTLPFPWNYSAASVYYAKCIDAEKTEGCFDGTGVPIVKRNMIRILGRMRHWVKVY